MAKRFKMIKFRIENTYTGRYICNDRMIIINFSTVNEARAYILLNNLDENIFQVVAVKNI